MKDKIFSEIYRQMSAKLEEILQCSAATSKKKADGLSAKAIFAKDTNYSIYRNAARNYLKKQGGQCRRWEPARQLEFTAGAFRCSVSIGVFPAQMYQLEKAFNISPKNRYQFQA